MSLLKSVPHRKVKLKLSNFWSVWEDSPKKVDFQEEEVMEFYLWQSHQIFSVRIRREIPSCFP
jgi:hypothetical protein